MIADPSAGPMAASRADSPVVAPAAPPAAHRYPLEFTGSGGEYFKIWIVNLLLTIVTIGIYSAWAKVRKNTYFYNNTRLDDSIFDYHGKPIAILKGRLIIVAMLALNNFLGKASLGFAIAFGIVVVAVLPWLIVQSFRFRLRNSSYRGLRFAFDGPVADAYRLFGVPVAAAVAAGVIASSVQTGALAPRVGLSLLGLVYLALLVALPYLHWRFKKFQHEHSLFGNAHGTFRGRVGRFYTTYLKGLLIAVGSGVVLVGLVALIGWASVAGHFDAKSGGMVAGIAAVIGVYVGLLAVLPFISARLQNHVWNHTLLGRIGFDSTLKAGRLVYVTLTNFVLIVVTLGMYTPFATVRSWRTRMGAVTVLSTSDLAGFVARQEQDVAATGEGAADLLGFDFSF